MSSAEVPRGSESIQERQHRLGCGDLIMTGAPAARREKSLRVKNCSRFRPEIPPNEWRKRCRLYDQIGKMSSPAQRFSLEPGQYVCSAVEYIEWEIWEPGCRIRAERWALRQNYKKVRLTQELPLPVEVFRKIEYLRNIKVKIAEDVWFCAADWRRCDGLSW